MPRVTPLPERGITHEHEGRHLVDRCVEPARLERGPVTAFMPARVTRGGIEQSIEEEKGDRPPRPPRQDCGGGTEKKSTHPDTGIDEGRPVAALHEFLHARSWNIRAEPLGVGETEIDGPLGRSAREAVFEEPLPVHDGASSAGVRHLSSGLPAQVTTVESC